ncbi:MAG: DUF6600 domain-containing protein [Pyrinomonadaceae bacterium]
MIVIAIVCAVAAGAGVALWMKHEQRVSAEALPNAARIERVDGDVALENGVSTGTTNAQWIAATPNAPFSVGDRIYTRDNSRASLAFTGRNFARLNPNTSLDILSLADHRTQLALRDGTATFDVGYLAPGELFEVATPYGAVDLNQPGLYNVGFSNGNVLVSVLSGLAQVVGLGGSGQISKGEMLTLVGQTAADVVLSRLDGRDAGYLVDDYYSSQYPQYYDGRYRDYDTYLNDPYYFDPYRRNVSYQYVTDNVPGINDLDYYGDWRDINGYGYAWCPRVDAGWAPYQQGYWLSDYPYGPTWVSSEPWGYAPYHYGRWAFANNQWFWVPDAVNTTPLYSPALVAFLPFNQANDIGWVPLGPGDPYVPRYYYTDNWQPYYLNNTDIVQTRVVNLDAPNAVTVVPVDQFGNVIDPRRVTRVDRQTLANVRPVLDPLTLTPLRNAVVHSAWGRGKIDLPPGIAKKLNDTSVIVSSAPVAPPFRKDLSPAMKVQSAPARAKGEKLRMRDERQPVQAQRGNGAPAPQQPQVSTGLAQGGRGNGRNGREQQQQFAPRQERMQPQMRGAERAQQQRAIRAAQQPQAERVGRPAQQQVKREVVRPTPPHAQQQPVRIQRTRPPLPVRQSRPQEQVRPQIIQRRPAPQMNRAPAPQVEKRAPAPQVERRAPAPQVERRAPAPQAQRQGPPAQAQQRQQAQPKHSPPTAGPKGGGKGKGPGKP